MRQLPWGVQMGYEGRRQDENYVSELSYCVTKMTGELTKGVKSPAHYPSGPCEVGFEAWSLSSND